MILAFHLGPDMTLTAAEARHGSLFDLTERTNAMAHI